MYLVAIPLFLLGSALCGLAQNMEQLVAFRIVQGLGRRRALRAGARDDRASSSRRGTRGRYQGLIGSTFIAGSIAGPALGGLIVDNASWRWIFYVNIPVGLVALAVIAVAIPKRSPRHEHCGRLSRRGTARGGDDVPAARARLGRPAVPVDLGRGPRRTLRVASSSSRPSPSWSGARPSRSCRTTCSATRTVAAGVGCDRALRDGDGRDDRLRAALRPGRDRHLGDLLGRRADAVLHRRRDHERGLRTVDLANAATTGRTPSPGRSSSAPASSCSRAWTRRRRASRPRGTWSSRGSASA